MKRHPGGGVEIVRSGLNPGKEVSAGALEEAKTMNIELKKQAFDLWDEHVTALSKRLGCSKTDAITRAIADGGDGSRLWSIVKNFTGGDVMKMGGVGGLPASATTPGHGGQAEPRRAGDTSSTPATPHRGVRHDVVVDDELHEGDAAKAYARYVTALMTRGMSESRAHTTVQQMHPQLWKSVKESGAAIPLQSQPRPPYGIPRYGEQ
jgi:hypothetical protein